MLFADLAGATAIRGASLSWTYGGNTVAAITTSEAFNAPLITPAAGFGLLVRPGPPSGGINTIARWVAVNTGKVYG